MGGAISSTVSLGLTYCACSSASSLCHACLGQTSAHTSGRRRSVLLLALAVLLALVFQYLLAPGIVGDGSGWWNFARKAPGAGKHVLRSWTDGCEQYLDGGEAASLAGPYGQCIGNAGVYRPTFFSFLFFACAAAASYLRPSLNREAWPAKYCVYLLLVLGSVFVSNRWFLGAFVPLARVGAMAFIVVQQIILIDLAYNWNDSWVGKADAADRVAWGSGARWLRATIGVCASFYSLALLGVGLLFHYFRGCGGNTAIVTLSLLMIIALTAVQLSGVEGSLLTSSVISLYVVYLGYSAVSKNPHEICNPQLARENNPYDIAVGLFLTAVSLAWTGWSWTAADRLSGDGVKKARSLGKDGGAAFRRGEDPVLELDDPLLEYHDEDRPPSGLALGSDDAADALPPASREVWKLNAILALVSCWVAMSLTGWGSVADGAAGGEGAGAHTAANPQAGRVNMAMIAASQWVAVLLYVWTLAAPRLFPDREFS